MIQKPHYLFWGFQGSPDQLTDTGRLLFPWACYYCVAMKQNPERAFATKIEAERKTAKQQPSSPRESRGDK